MDFSSYQAKHNAERENTGWTNKRKIAPPDPYRKASAFNRPWTLLASRPSVASVPRQSPSTVRCSCVWLSLQLRPSAAASRSWGYSLASAFRLASWGPSFCFLHRFRVARGCIVQRRPGRAVFGGTIPMHDQDNAQSAMRIARAPKRSEKSPLCGRGIERLQPRRRGRPGGRVGRGRGPRPAPTFGAVSFVSTSALHVQRGVPPLSTSGVLLLSGTGAAFKSGLPQPSLSVPDHQWRHARKGATF